MLEKYLDTLELIPDDILLSALTRDLDLNEPNLCLCGWVLREKMARVAGVDAEEIKLDEDTSVVRACMDKFGGDWEEWNNIYMGVINHEEAPTIERALMLRVLEAVQ